MNDLNQYIGKTAMYRRQGERNKVSAVITGLRKFRNHRGGEHTVFVMDNGDEELVDACYFEVPITSAKS